MGGRGSGCSYHWWRPARKTTVEDCRSLDAGVWTREGILKAGVWQAGCWRWLSAEDPTEETASLGYQVNTLAGGPWVRLSYRLGRTGEDLDYRVALTTTRRLGGLRWWFV